MRLARHWAVLVVCSAWAGSVPCWLDGMGELSHRACYGLQRS